MDFKVGDRVRYKGSNVLYLGLVGEIVSIVKDAVDGKLWFHIDVGEEYPYHFLESQIELYNENEIESHKSKEPTSIEELEQRIEKLEKEVLKPAVENNRPKEIKPSLLTEDERVILRNLDKGYIYIARDGLGNLIVFKEHPFRGECTWLTEILQNHAFLQVFNHLFKFIKWEDEITYNIEELLKGECGNE